MRRGIGQGVVLCCLASVAAAEDWRATYTLYGTPGLIEMPSAVSPANGELATTLGGFSTQQRGTVDHTPVYPREVVKRALELSASAIILVHNHPSGDPTPSRADIEMTNAVVKAAKALNIAVHDHLVIGHKSEASFKTLGLL